MKVLVIGAGGMVGRAVVEHCAGRGDQVSAPDRQDLDVTNSEAVVAAFEQARPEVVINCAAWTDVDGCEIDPQRAYEVNARAVEKMALHARRADACFITISTDYVFDGSKQGFYTQRDDPHPLSVYAASKLQGERYAQLSYARAVVVRTGWIFGVGGRNFLARAIELVRRGERLKAIGDAYGTPTYATDLAVRLRELAELDLPGVYHVVNGGNGTSYADFARAAAEVAGARRAEIEEISADTLRRLAPRPRNSRLRCLLSDAVGLGPLPYWRDALKHFAAQTLSAADLPESGRLL